MPHSPECLAAQTSAQADLAAYVETFPDHCHACEGWGVHRELYDPSPAGVALGAGYMVEEEPCPDCLGAMPDARCPRCGETLPTDSQNELAAVPCVACGWTAAMQGRPQGSAECHCFDAHDAAEAAEQERRAFDADQAL